MGTSKEIAEMLEVFEGEGLPQDALDSLRELLLQVSFDDVEAIESAKRDLDDSLLHLEETETRIFQDENVRAALSKGISEEQFEEIASTPEAQELFALVEDISELQRSMEVQINILGSGSAGEDDV